MNKDKRYEDMAKDMWNIFLTHQFRSDTEGFRLIEKALKTVADEVRKEQIKKVNELIYHVFGESKADAFEDVRDELLEAIEAQLKEDR